jgi:hypothetical protein
MVIYGNYLVKGDILNLYLTKSEMKLLENISFYYNINLEILLGLIIVKNRFDKKLLYVQMI